MSLQTSMAVCQKENPYKPHVNGSIFPFAVGYSVFLIHSLVKHTIKHICHWSQPPQSARGKRVAAKPGAVVLSLRRETASAASVQIVAGLLFRSFFLHLLLLHHLLLLFL